jgi:ribonucleoside-diphosphate reductase alpha chain
LDCVIEEYIEKGKKLAGMQKAVRFAEEHRAIGLGILGFHSYLQKKGIVFGELASYNINHRIFSKLRSESDRASVWMAKHFGEPEMLKGYGLRNTTRLAQAPTKSTSYIMGGITLNMSEGVEPHKSNFMTKKLAKIQSEVKNKELVDLLESKDKNKRDVWDSILLHNGSVQHLEFLSEREKAVFKTFSEISQVDVIKLAGQRQKFIDQGQSINLMIHPDTPANEINKLHLLAFDEGVKSLYYQYSINAAQEFNKDLLTCSSCEA